MSAWQFAFVCSRVLAAWLAVTLVGYVSLLGVSFVGYLEAAKSLPQGSGGVESIALFAPTGFSILSTSFISIMFWVNAGKFADYATADAGEAETPRRTVIEWERPLVFLVGLWLFVTALSEAAGFLLGVGYGWKSLDDNLLARGYDAGIAAALVRLVLGLIVMTNARRLAQWSRGDLAADIKALRTAGVAKPTDDPPA